jgi:hypothetical protein
MDKNYLNQLWAWTNSQDPTFKDRYTFDSWSQKLSSDEAYKQKFYGWVSGIDNTFQERRPYETWSGLVTVSDKKKEESALPSREEGTSLATPKMAGPKPLASSRIKQVKNPSSFNKNIESSDYQRHTKLASVAINAADKGDKNTLINTLKEMNAIRSMYPAGVFESDKQMSEDLQSIEKVAGRKKLDVDIKTASRLPVPQKKIELKLPQGVQIKASDIKQDPEDLKRSVQADLIELEALDFERADKQVEEEFAQEGISDKVLGMVNKWTVGKGWGYIPTETEKAIAKATNEVKSNNPDASAEDILTYAKEQRKKELLEVQKDEAVDSYFEGKSLIGIPEEQVNIERSLENVKNKQEYHIAKFNKKTQEIERNLSTIKLYKNKIENKEELTPEDVNKINYAINNVNLLYDDLQKNYKNIETDDKDLKNTEEEIDRFKRNYSYVTNAGARVSNWAIEATAGLAGFMGMQQSLLMGGLKDATGVDVSQANIWDDISKSLSDTSESIKQSIAKNKELKNVNSIGDFAEWSGQLVLDQAPQIVLAMATGGAAVPLMGASAAGSKFEEIKDDEKYTMTQKVVASYAVGLAEALSEKIELDVIKYAFPSSRIAKAAAKTKTDEEILKQSLRTGIKGATINNIEKLGMASLNFNKEGISEVIAQLGTNLTDRYILDKKDVSILDGIDDAYLSGAVIGGAMIAAPAFASKVISPFVYDPEKNVSKNVSKIAELTKALGIATKESDKKIIQGQIDKLNNDNFSIVDAAINRTKNLSPDEIREGVRSIERMQEIKSEIADIRGNASYSTEAKNAMVSGLLDEYNQLVLKRKQLIDKANAVQEQATSEVPVQPEAGVPEEISSLNDDEQVVLTVQSLDEIPEQFRDRATKKEGTEIEVRNSILGLPIGKKTTKVVNEGYTYTLTGKEAKDYAIQKQTTSEVSIQPEARVGEKVAQGKPQTEPKITTKEGVQEEVVIDKPTISTNSKVEVDKVVSATPETETGQTFNSDGTVYADGGLVIPVVSENLTQEELTPERIAEFTEKHKNKIGSKAVKIGIYKFPNSNQVSIDLNIVVPRSNREIGIEFGRIAGQESLFDLDTFENIKTGSDGKNPMTFTDEQFKEISKALEEGRMPEIAAQPVQQAVAQNIQETDENYQESRDAVMQIAQDQKEFVPGDAVLEQVTTDADGNVTGGVVTFLDADRNPTRKTISRAQTAPAKTGIVENVKKAISKLFPKLEAKNFNSATEMREYARSKYGDAVADQVQDDDAARVLLDQNNEPIAILVNDQLSDETTLPHEAWHPIMLKAFGDNQKLFSQFRAQIKKALIDNGFKDIADQLDAFANQEEYKKTGVDAEEWLVQFGALLTNKKIDASKLTPKQKSLIEKLRDIINSFMSKVSGQSVFNETSSAKDILDFMASIADSMAKGEDISAKVTPAKTDKSGNLPKPTTKAQKSLKDKNKEIEKSTKEKVSKGDNVSTRIPSKGDPHKKSDLIVSTKVAEEAAKTDKTAEQYLLKLASVLAEYPNVNIDGKSIRTINDANFVFDKFKKNVKDNLKWLYNQFSDEVRTITKLWYDGANIVSNEIANQYGYSTNQVSGVMAVLSPQMDWFRNLSLGKRVIDIYNTKMDSTLDDKMADYIRNANTGTGKKVTPLFEGPANKLTEKSIDLLIKEMQGKTFREMSLPEKAFFVRAYDEVYNTRDYENISPTGEINGFVMTDKGSRAKVGWGGFGPIMKAISILENGSIENISENLGNQHKVRNFFVNISNPNDKNAVTIDTHAVAAALLKPLAGSDAEVNTNLSGPPKSATTGLVGSYPVLADAYRELANELGILPRELQSITWEAVRGLYKASFKQSAKNKKAINDIWEEYRIGKITEKELYEQINTKAGGVSKPVWYEYVAEGDVKINEENSAAINQGELSDDYRGEGLEPDTKVTEVKTKAQKAPKYVPESVYKYLTEDADGNIVFHHYSKARRDEIKPSTGSGSFLTSREEQQALSSVGGLGMYYTQQGQKEPGVGDERHTVVVPKEKIYYMTSDPLNLYDEARARFLDYMNRNNDVQIEYAFNPNYQTAWITKVAQEKGFDMVISKWKNDADYRAQSSIALKPIEEDLPMKDIEDNIEVGDRVFVSGAPAIITSIDENGLATYKQKNSSGKFDIELGKRTERYGKMTLLDKGPFEMTEDGEIVPAAITTRGQKASRERMMSELDGVIAKSKERKATKETVYNNALAYLQGSKVYEEADDVERESLVRELRKKLGLKEKSVSRIFSLKRKDNGITVNERIALREQIRLEAKAAKDAIQARQKIGAMIKDQLSGMFKKGIIKTAQLQAINRKLLQLNFFNQDHVENFINYMDKVFRDAEYADKLSKANALQARIKRSVKDKTIQAETRDTAKEFSKLAPYLATDIDAYIAAAEEVYEAVQQTKGTVTDGIASVTFKKAMNYERVQEYTKNEAAAQEEARKQQLIEKNKYLLEAGVLDESMSLKEMMSIIASIEADPGSEAAKDKEKIIRDYVNKYFDSYRTILEEIIRTDIDPFTGERMYLTDAQRKQIGKFLEVDLNVLSLKDAYNMVNAIDNFVMNQNTDGMEATIAAYEGKKNNIEAQKRNLIARPLRAFWSKTLGRNWGEQFEQITMMHERMFGGVQRAIEFDRLSGLSKLLTDKVKALKSFNAIVENYANKFGKIKDFNKAENVFERGMLGIVARNVQGSETEQQEEFNKQKKNIEISIKAMEKGTDKQKKEAVVARKVYDKILKDSNSYQDAKKKAGKENVMAVEFWQNEFANIFDSLQDVSRGVYNTILDRDVNYLPHTYKRFGKTEDKTDISEEGSAFMGINEGFDTKETGVLMKATKPKLTETSTPSRILSFDFDTNMSRAIQGALIDINTASTIRQISSFYSSEGLEKIIPRTEDRDMAIRRMKSFIKKVKKKDYVQEDSFDTLAKAANYISSFSASRALGSISQIPKQTISVAANTMINTGGNIAIFDVFKAKDFIDNSGYGISIRGIASQADIQSINQILKKAEESKGKQALDYLKKLNDMYLELFVASPDVYIARASWLAYYKKKLKSLGVDTDNIDWSTHEINTEAGDYAQRMTDRQQNFSDSDLAGEIMSNKKPIVQLLRKSLFPFASFGINKKAQLMGDMSVLYNPLSSSDDKKAAVASLASWGVEMAVYSGVSIFIGNVVYNFIANLMADYEEDEEEKEKKYTKAIQYRTKNAVVELLSPIPNVADDALVDGINFTLNSVGVDEQFRLPEGKGEKLYEKVGLTNIMQQKLANLSRMTYAGATGTYVDKFGNEKEMSKEDQQRVASMAAVYAFYAFGFVPADFGITIDNAYYKLGKKSKKAGSGGGGKSAFGSIDTKIK